MKLFVHQLPPRYNLELLDRHPALNLDFWLVEHLVHQRFLQSPLLTSEPADANWLLIPFYPACYQAAYAYQRGISVARPSRIDRIRMDIALHRGFTEVMEMVRRNPCWSRRGGRDHLMVFGYGKGATGGYIWRRYKSVIRSLTLLGVEACPYYDPKAFDTAKDIVIPAYTPWPEVMEQAAAQKVERDILLHFRGRKWGPVRPAVFSRLKVGPNSILTEQCPYAMGGENQPGSADDALRYFTELRRSVFALCPAGWTPWSKRFYEAVQMGCIPVVIPGTFVPPFPDSIDYESFVIRTSLEELPELESRLRTMAPDRIASMQAAANQVRRRLAYISSTDTDDAGALLLRSLDRKLAHPHR